MLLGKRKVLFIICICIYSFFVFRSKAEAGTGLEWMNDYQLSKYLERRNIDTSRVNYNYLRQTGLLVLPNQGTGPSNYYITDYNWNTIPNQLADNIGPVQPGFYDWKRSDDRLIWNPCRKTMGGSKPQPINCLDQSVDLSRVYDQFEGRVVDHERFREFASINKYPYGYAAGLINYYNYGGDGNIYYSTEIIMPKDPVDLHPVDLSIEEIKVEPNKGSRNKPTEHVWVRVKNNSDDTYKEGHVLYKWGPSDWGCMIVRDVPNTTDAPDGIWYDLAQDGAQGCFGYSPDIAKKMQMNFEDEKVTFFAEINRDGFRNITERVYDGDGNEIPHWISGVYNNNSKTIDIPLEETHDLELVDFDVISTPPNKSDNAVKEIKAKITNHSTTKTFQNVPIQFYWKDNPSLMYCEILDSIGPGQTKTVSLGNGSLSKCSHISSPNKVVFPRYKDQSSSKQMKFVVDLNPAGAYRQPEADYTNNTKEKNVPVTGLNATIQTVRVFQDDPTNSDSKITISTRVYNDMSKKIDAPCTTNGTNESCNGTQNNFVIDIYNRDTGALVTSITNPNAYQNVKAYDGYTVSTDTRLPYGKYKVVVKMPHYEYEYNFVDNQKDYSFDIEKQVVKGLTCKPTSTQYINGDFNRFCVGIYPRQPSTLSEQGEGMFAYVNYRLMPSPIPPYSLGSVSKNSMQQPIHLNETNINSNGESRSFIRHSDAMQGNSGMYVYRGRMFAKEIKFDVQILDPKGKTIPNSVGTLYYKVPDTCYDSYSLDFSQNCRTVDFYIGMNPSGDIGGYNKAPSKDNKIKFKNPGAYTYKIEARENQYYRYQTSYSSDTYNEKGELISTNYYWGNPQWYNGTLTTPFQSPTNFNSYRQPAWHFNYSSWNDKNDLYKFYFPFSVTGISTGAGSN